MRHSSARAVEVQVGRGRHRARQVGGGGATASRLLGQDGESPRKETSKPEEVGASRIHLQLGEMWRTLLFPASVQGACGEAQSEDEGQVGVLRADIKDASRSSRTDGTIISTRRNIGSRG